MITFCHQPSLAYDLLPETSCKLIAYSRYIRARQNLSNKFLFASLKVVTDFTKFTIPCLHYVKISVYQVFCSAFSCIPNEYGYLLGNLRIQFECGKIATRKIPNTNTFYSLLFVKLSFHLKLDFSYSLSLSSKVYIC